MGVTDTSLESFERVLPKLGEMQSQVLIAMKDLRPRSKV